MEFVLGYTCGNDVSARDWQMRKQKQQWARGKSFDTFCPLGPFLVTKDEIPDPNRLRIRSILNGRVMQDSSTSDMLFPVAQIVSDINRSMTLLPRTVIMTCTKEGVGLVRNAGILRPARHYDRDRNKSGTDEPGPKPEGPGPALPRATGCPSGIAHQELVVNPGGLCYERRGLCEGQAPFFHREFKKCGRRALGERTLWRAQEVSMSDSANERKHFFTIRVDCLVGFFVLSVVGVLRFPGPRLRSCLPRG